MIKDGLNKLFNKVSRGDENFKELLSHSKNYITANLFLKGITFLTLPIFTRLLDPSDYGKISLYTTIFSILSLFYLLGTDGALYRYYFEKGNSFDEFLGSQLLFLSGVCILIAVLLLVFKNSIINFFSLDDFIFTYAIYSAIFTIPISLYLVILQAEQNSKKYTLINILRYLVIVILSIILILNLSENKYYGRIYAEVIVGILVMIYSLYFLLKRAKFNFKYEYVKYALILGIPVLPHLFSSQVLYFFDRFIINKVNGEQEVGLYSFAFNIGMVMNTLVMGMNQSWVPIFYKKLTEEKESDINKLSSKYIKIIFTIAIVFIMFARELVVIMGEQRYYSSLIIIPMIVLGYVFVYLYTLYANYAFYLKKNYIVSIFTIISGIISVILNIYLVPKYGYKSASFSALVSFASLFILHYINVKFILKVKNIIPLKIIYFKVLIVFLNVIIFYFLYNLNLYIVWELIFKIIVMVISIFMIRNL